jgi:hypothetical protein
MLGSYCLLAITGSGLGIIYNHDDNNDDVTPVFIYVHALCVVNHKTIYFNWNMENHLEKQCNHNTIWLWSG